MALFATIALQSCDMSKYYFRMHSTSKNKHFQTDSRPISVKSESFNAAEKKDISTTSDSLGYSSYDLAGTALDSTQLIKTHTPINSPKLFFQKTNELETVKRNTQAKEQHGISTSQKAKSSFPSEIEMASVFFFFLMILIIFIGICVFLISWVFTPAMLALKIALWTMAGLAILPIILFLIVLFLNI
ncbi:MAG: hypothetical protein QE487_10700 [Fluviicola sp.]|nr:hypothetical protein [Fluviicola sp.]